MSQVTWQIHFKEQVQGLTEAFERIGSSKSLLAYALKEKKIATDEYMKWAQKNFGLPLLHTRYFTETPLSQEMFAKWATHYRWSAECLPVAEWDGTLIVACLEPPQDFPSTPGYSLVIAHPAALELAWEDLQKHTLFSSQAESDSPLGLSSDLAKIPSAKPDSFSLEEMMAQSKPADFQSSEESSEDEHPSKEDENLGLLQLEPLTDGPTLIRITPLEAKLEAKSEEPPPLAPMPIPSAEPASAKVAATPTPPPPPVVAAKDEEPEFEKTRVSVAKKMTPDEKPVVMIPVVPAAPLPVLNTAEQSENRNFPTSTLSGVNGKPKSTPLPHSSFVLEKFKKRNGPLMTEKIKKTFSDMRTHFQKSMILTVDDTESQIMAFAWDDTFQGIPDTSVRIPLKTPSIFNIVSSTQKPFHGYVSLNQLNEKFFEDWNHGTIPDHITVTPIMSEDKVIAMLVGFADKSAYNKTTLQWAEKLSAEFIKNLAA